MQIMASEVASPPFVEKVLAFGYSVGRTEEDRYRAVHLLDRLQVPVAEADTLAHTVDTVARRLVAAVGLPAMLHP